MLAIGHRINLYEYRCSSSLLSTNIEAEAFTRKYPLKQLL